MVNDDFPDFAVACGEEASDPTVLFEGREVRVDELAASAHLSHQDRDLAAVAGLGVRWWRYGMPWRLTEPAPDIYDWSLWDRALAACERHGLEPVVDLCHFGLPDHYRGFCDPAWVDGFGRYVEAFLARYREPRFFTPINEPAITAQCSALWGIWNDRRASRRDHLRALVNVVVANVEAIARIDADRAGWWIGAEGFGCHVAASADDEPAVEDARAFEDLVWDLHFGVEPHPSFGDLADHVDRTMLDRILGVGVDALATRAREVGEPERLDVGLATEAERPFDLDFDPEALAVEAVLVATALALHSVEADDRVLQGAAPCVVDTHRVVRGDRPVEEAELGAPSRRARSRSNASSSSHRCSTRGSTSRGR